MDIPKVHRMREWIHTNWYPGGVGPCFKENNEPPLGCADHSRWEGFANVTMDKIFLTSELDSYLADPEYGCTADKPELVLGIHFHSVPGTGALGAPGDWSYAIRMNFTTGRVPPTSMGKVSRLQRGLDTGTADTYMQGGFVATQLLVDRYIIGQRNDTLSTDDILRHNNYDWAALGDAFKDFDAVLERQKLAEPLRYAPSRLEISPLPIDGFDMDIFYQLVKDIVPMYFILTFLYTQKKVINELIAEKESRVRESLRMLGMGNAALFGAWYITYAVIFAALCIVFTIAACFRVFYYASPTLLFLFFWLWCMSFVSFAFLIQPFFDKARTGGIIGMLLSFAQWVLYEGITANVSPTRGVLTSLMLLPNCAFCVGIQLFAEFESSAMGASWSNLTVEVENVTLLRVLGMMVLDTIIFTFLGWYFDHVVPSEFGVRHPPWFLFTAAYWRSTSLDGEPRNARHCLYLHTCLCLRRSLRRRCCCVSCLHPSLWVPLLLSLCLGFGGTPSCAALCLRPLTAIGLRAGRQDAGELGFEDASPAPGSMSDVIEPTTAAHKQAEIANRCVKIDRLRKVFSTPAGPKTAVESLSLSMYEGEIFALLGHNGAGKTVSAALCARLARTV